VLTPPVSGFRAVYDSLSTHYGQDASSPYFRHVLTWLMARLPGRGRVLDVGCGTGRYALALAARGFEVVALDESAAMISQCCVKPGAERVSFRVLDATTSMPEGPFDAVLLIDTWEFLADPAKTLWHVRSVLRAGALGFIVTPHPAWRLPISIAEALRIKRLRPAFGYRNGARRVIEVAALAGGLTVREMTWVYGTLARVAILEVASDATQTPSRDGETRLGPPTFLRRAIVRARRRRRGRRREPASGGTGRGVGTRRRRGAGTVKHAWNFLRSPTAGRS
jgi:SAM-dependent methyltransferase